MVNGGPYYGQHSCRRGKLTNNIPAGWTRLWPAFLQMGQSYIQYSGRWDKVMVINPEDGTRLRSLELQAAVGTRL
jgi:hypothetical protein